MPNGICHGLSKSPVGSVRITVEGRSLPLRCVASQPPRRGRPLCDCKGIMGKANPLPEPGDSPKAELKQLRAASAAVYQSHAPNWRGESYATRTEYPAVTDDFNSPGWTDGNNARTVVWACDWMLALLKATRSKSGHVISEQDLENLLRWYALLAEIQLLTNVKPLFMAGLRQLSIRPAMMRAAKAEGLASKRRENHQRAFAAKEDAKRKFPIATEQGKESFLEGKAAEQLGVSRRTFGRWLGKSK